MKKLLAMLLSMIMVLSLAVPAFAAPAPETGPEDVIPISAILDESLGIIGGADGPTVIVTGSPEDGSYIDALKTALGGVPGQIGVMVNGTYVKFPDAAPEISSSRTMVPVRALVETLGGKIEYQNGIVQFTIGGYVYEFAIGRTTVMVTPAADNDKDTPKPDDIIMDCAPYIKGNRTYVPIRFISEALGYDVGWDNDFRTVILSNRDMEDLANQIDKNFTIMNKVQAAGALSLKDGQSAQATLKGDLTLTLASLEGNKTYKADFDASTLMNSEAVNGSCSVTISEDAIDALLEQVIGAGTNAGDEDAELLRTVLTGLKDMEVILTQDKAWAHAPILDELSGQENVWFATAMDLGGGMDLSTLLSGTETTVGTAVASMADNNSVMSWFTMMQTVNILELYTDDKFTTSGGTSTLTIGLDELMGIYEDIGLSAGEIEAAKAVFEEYEITMKVDSNGQATVTCKMETVAESGVPAIKMTMDATQYSGNATVTMAFEVGGMGKLELTLTSTQKATTDKPDTEPPEGAAIINTDAPAVLPE